MVNKAVPSLELASVEAFKAVRDEYRRRRAKARAIQEERVAPHHTSESGRRFFRRDLIERVAAARAVYR